MPGAGSHRPDSGYLCPAARTHEGKLQVELAQLEHMSTRLVRGWTHLERQKGGIGLRGPGETQLETDRRLLRARIVDPRATGKSAQAARQGRRSRRRARLPVVSLVGYTNAGKSTLFSRLTESDIYAADQLFATLDPTLPHGPRERRAGGILVDTVGFIAHLPINWWRPFRATLEKPLTPTCCFVIDAATEQREDNIHQCRRCWLEMAQTRFPNLQVYNNKLDLLAQEPRIDRNIDGVPERVWVSAVTGAGTGTATAGGCRTGGQDMVEETLDIARRAEACGRRFIGWARWSGGLHRRQGGAPERAPPAPTGTG